VARTSRRTVGRDAPRSTSRSAELDGFGRRIEQRDQRAKFAILRREHAGRGRGIETSECLPTPVVVAGDPDTDAAPSHDFHPGRAQVALNRREVVANDPRGEFQLRCYRVEGGGFLVGEQQPRDTRLAAVERQDERQVRTACSRARAQI
jgi:hypothetical protein